MARVTTAVLLLWLGLSAAKAELPACPGDCDGDGVVRITELIRGVKASLSFGGCVIPEPELCPAIDSCFFDDVDGRWTVREVANGISRIIRAVRSSLRGCDYEERLAADRARLDELAAEILAPLEAPQACRDTSDCRYAGFGDKPCGGPWRYVIYSQTAVDADELLAEIADYNQLDEEYNRRWGVLSTCDIVGPPDPVCEDDICVEALPR